MAATRDYKIEYAKRKARAIIKAREAKRGKPLSPTYKKRVERALQKGKTLQQARGHKPAEHIERKQREIEREENAGLTNAQVREVFDFGERRALEIRESDLDGWDYVAAAQASGFKWFKNYSKIYRAARSTYLQEMRSGTWESRGEGYLQDLTDRANAPEVSWLYYH